MWLLGTSSFPPYKIISQRDPFLGVIRIQKAVTKVLRDHFVACRHGASSGGTSWSWRGSIVICFNRTLYIKLPNTWLYENSRYLIITHCCCFPLEIVKMENFCFWQLFGGAFTNCCNYEYTEPFLYVLCLLEWMNLWPDKLMWRNWFKLVLRLRTFKFIQHINSNYLIIRDFVLQVIDPAFPITDYLGYNQGITFSLPERDTVGLCRFFFVTNFSIF